MAMGRVQVGEHIWIRLSRRSLCDNCTAELCVYNTGERVTQCDRFTPRIMAFKRCSECGRMFEVNENFRGLDYGLCPVCNRSRIAAHS